MDKEGMDFLKGSVCDASVCAEAVSGVDAVVHLAENGHWAIHV